MDKRMFKKTPEELQMYMHFKKRHGVSKIKKVKVPIRASRSIVKNLTFLLVRSIIDLYDKCSFSSVGRAIGLHPIGRQFKSVNEYQRSFYDKIFYKP